MYLVTAGPGFDQFSDMFVQTIKDIIPDAKTVKDIFVPEEGKFNLIKSSVDTIKKGLTEIRKIKLDTSLIPPESEPKFTFNTYIPAEMAMSMISDWSDIELFSKVDTAAKGLTALSESIPGFTGSGAKMLAGQYESIKNHLQYYGAIGITPPAVKIFKPSFLDQFLDFEFIPESQKEANDLLIMMKVFKESQIPYSNDGEVFNFPAVFKMNVKMVKDVVTNEKDSIADLFLNFENLGLQEFNVTALSGDHIDAKVKKDGKFPGYKVSMKFTTINRMYSNEKIDARINEYLGQIK